MTTSRREPTPDMQNLLKPLDALRGVWNIEIQYPDPPMTLQGRATFEWFEASFLVEYSEVDHPAFPKGMAVMGVDEPTGTLVQHYFDSRGVTRLYHMSFEGKVWKIWRDDPDFSQRFTGTFSDDGKTITIRLEKSFDGGTNWKHDFDETFTKVSS